MTQLFLVIILALGVGTNISANQTQTRRKNHDPFAITKVVIPAAGFGTRMLPFTKSVPKEMLPIINKPAIQYIVEESIHSGINDIIVITAAGKEAIANHFDTLPLLERFLKAKNKLHLIDDVNNLIQAATYTTIRQPEQLGLGHAVGMAQHSIEDEYFGVILPDDLFEADTPALKQLVEIAQQEHASVIGVQEVPMEQVARYGVVALEQQLGENVWQISDLIEKPQPDQAPSNLAICGRYVLSSNVFDALKRTQAGAGGEIQLTDAIKGMMQEGERVLAVKIDGTRYDIGNPKGWLEANIAYALHDPEYSDWITRVVGSHHNP